MFEQYFVLALSSFLIGELLAKLKVKVVFVFQGLENAKNNLIKLSQKVGNRGSSNLILGFGKRIVNMHHSRFGWILASLGLIFVNLSLLSFSSGFIIHHLLREKSLF